MAKATIARACCVVGLAVAAVGLAATASSAATPIATVTAQTPVSQGRGWIVWSERQATGWRLIAWHAGQARVLPIAARPQPFDADVGTDAGGRPVVTFSRCAVTPHGAYSDLVAVWAGRACRAHVADLATGTERTLPIPRRPGDSDTSPSMWRGRVAFARTVPASIAVSRVLLFDSHARRLRTLKHGATAGACTSTPCRPVTGNFVVDGLDLGADLVTFRWYIAGGAPLTGNNAWEVRADPLSGNRSILVGAGRSGEACTGGTDLAGPASPTASGTSVWFTELSLACGHPSATAIRVTTPNITVGFAGLDAAVLESSIGPAGGVALVSTTSSIATGPTCDTPGQPCTIETITAPPLQRTSSVITGPFSAGT